jgi:hypothetical protein
MGVGILHVFRNPYVISRADEWNRDDFVIRHCENR